MHPRAFIDSYWRNDLRNEIFVAMPFDDRYDNRWKTIFVPAIESVQISGQALKAIRVDIRKTGDSILTEINDGILHSQLVLADVSVVERALHGEGEICHRNGNVMFEVGIAIACRQPVEVLLVRDDRDKLLFDVSHIPVTTFDPTKEAESTQLIQKGIIDRLRERDLLRDIRLTKTIESLTPFEINVIRTNAHLNVLGWSGDSLPAAVAMALPELLRKQVLRLHSIRTETVPDAYTWTTLGRVIANRFGSSLPVQ